MMAEQCVNVSYRHAWGGSRCPHPGKVKIGGRWFCGVHSPELIEQRRTALQAQWDAADKARAEERLRLRTTPHDCPRCGLTHSPREEEL